MASTSVKFAVIDVGDFLNKKQSSNPELAEEWTKLEELYNKKFVQIIHYYIEYYLTLFLTNIKFG